LAVSAKTLHLRRPVGIFLTRRKNSRSSRCVPPVGQGWARRAHLRVPQKRVNEDQLFTRRLDPQCSIMAYTEVILCRSPLRGNVLLTESGSCSSSNPVSGQPSGWLPHSDSEVSIVVRRRHRNHGSVKEALGDKKTRLIGSANWIPPQESIGDDELAVSVPRNGVPGPLIIPPSSQRPFPRGDRSQLVVAGASGVAEVLGQRAVSV